MHLTEWWRVVEGERFSAGPGGVSPAWFANLLPLGETFTDLTRRTWTVSLREPESILAWASDNLWVGCRVTDGGQEYTGEMLKDIQV